MRNKNSILKGAVSPSKGALIAIAFLFVSSGALRLGNGSGAAIALEVKERASKLMSMDGTVEDADEVVDITPELLKLLEQTQAREAAVAKLEAELNARAQALALAESTIHKDLARLEEAEEILRNTMSAADKAAENDIGRLTSVYENMKPDQAAALFQLMEPSFAAGFLGRMRPDAAAAIMAGLSPDLGYTISVVLAGRNADVPRETVPEKAAPAPIQQ